MTPQNAQVMAWWLVDGCVQAWFLANLTIEALSPGRRGPFMHFRRQATSGDATETAASSLSPGAVLTQRRFSDLDDADRGLFEIEHVVPEC